MKGIVWLASYPKSGNTWIRIFLSNLLADGDTPVDINELKSSSFSSRQIFDAALGWETSDLSADAIFKLRPRVQEVLALEDDTFFKVHEAFTHPENGEPLFSLTATRAALYLVRNPLDVAVSYSEHLGIDIDSTIKRMNDPTVHLATGDDELHSQLAQPLGDWSQHVRSWADAPGLRVQVIRYEDLLDNPYRVFAAACRFLALTDEPDRISKAVKYSSFNELRNQETVRGFREKLSSDRKFFRSGRAGDWRQTLSQQQVAAITKTHGEVMRRFGYIRPDGTIL